LRTESITLILENLLNVEQAALSGVGWSGCPIFLYGILCHLNAVSVTGPYQSAQALQTNIDVSHEAEYTFRFVITPPFSNQATAKIKLGTEG
jgi:hypothetical protein